MRPAEGEDWPASPEGLDWLRRLPGVGAVSAALDTVTKLTALRSAEIPRRNFS
eukprot:COSAG05_NODE_21340_length_272_cov_1.184971_1_plen_52_part_01